jgi:hypothetical protein
MLSCELCRDRMLEYLYDLLEVDERQAWDAHLFECAACQAELARAKTQKQLLAQAAKREFADVRFTAPAAEPAVLLLNKPRPRVRVRRWLVAAAVLVGLGVAAPLLWYGLDYRRDEEIIAQAKNRVETAQTELHAAEARIRRLPQEKAEHVEAILNAQREAKLKVKVTGPATLRAGAPTDYQISTTNLNDHPTDAKLTVSIKVGNETLGKPVEAKRVGEGNYHLTLPADLPLGPNSHPSLFVSAKRENGSQVELHEEMQLAAPVYVTHLELDKPMYQLGETVYFRSLTLDRFSLKPPQEDLDLQFFLASPGPGNPERLIAQGRTSLYEVEQNVMKPLNGPDGKPLRGIGVGSVVLDENAPGGEYALIVRETRKRFPEQRRKFLVNKYEKPKLNKELDFSRKSYGPGDEVSARCTAKYLDGKPVKNCRVEAVVSIDNRQYGSQGEPSSEAFLFQTDEEGRVSIHFKLPKEIERGLGTVSVRFDERAMPETIVRPLPIVLKKLDVEFFPEGGDLVADLPNRVYFQVRSTLGKPADLKGRILEDGKPLDVVVETLASEKTPELNQGMGRFEFIPKAGRKYELQVDSPVGVTKRHELPKIKADGVVLSLPAGVVKADQDIAVTVRSKTKRSLMVGAYCRGRLLDSTEMNAGEDARATLHPTSGAGGVCRITVFEILPGDGARRNLRPVAERLIYRQPAEFVHLALTPDQQSYVPRQAVKLGVAANSENGEPIPAVVMVRVVDKSVIKLADDKTLRTMPTHFLLTTEVRRPEDLEYADFLLGSHPHAADALDLLLGTQGWRRFAEQDPTQFRNREKEDADRLLVTIGQSQPQTTDLTQKELEKVEKEDELRLEAFMAQAEKAKRDEQEARDDREYQAALAALNKYDDFLDRTRRFGTPALGGLLAATAILCLVLALYRRFGQALPFYLATAACCVAVVLLAKLFWQASPRNGNQDTSVALLREGRERSAPMAAAGKHQADDAKAEHLGRAGGELGIVRKNEAFLDKAGGAGMAVPGAPMPAEKMPQPAFGQGMAEGKGDALKRLAVEAKKRDGAFDDKAKRRGAAGNRKMMEQAGLQGPMAGKPGRMPAPGMPPMPMMPPMLQQMDRMENQLQLRARVPELPPMPVRVFAHAKASGPAEERYDFAETLYWHPVLVLPGGRAQVSFDLCDSLGSFEVTAFAHTLDGRLGSASTEIISRLPFTVQPRLPLEVTAGDKLDIPLAVTNNTNDTRSARVAVLEHNNLALESAAEADGAVPANTGIRKLYRFRPTIQEGLATLAFSGKADGFPADTVRSTIRIVPEGFPIVGSHSDVLEKSATSEVTLPKNWVKGTLKCSVQVYPSTLADLQKGLDSLLREPCGCFEQTSTSNYPNILVLQYLKESDQTKPEVERRAHELLDRGYQKLVSFECLNPSQNKKEGYEWFGGTSPAHEALTAYGLMEFRDMAAVHDVDAAMIRRTQQYLLDQRDGQGGFKRNPRALDTFGRAPKNITDAYIVWAITEGGKDDDIGKELAALSEQAKESKDPYFLSLVANSLISRAKTTEAAKLLKKVADLQKADGHLDAEQTSITGSGGRDLQIETTALAVLGWLRANPGSFNAPVQKAVKWIGQQRGGYGGFGSTQSTILALKALILYTKANKKTPESGEVRLFVADKQVAALPFPAGTTEPLSLSVPSVEKTLQPGKNTIRVEITGKNVFPYTLAWSYQTHQPASVANCPVQLSAKLDRTEARESETVHLNVHVENPSDKGQGMAVAILGLPGGLTVPEDMKQLKDYIRLPNDGSRPLISAFELRGRELVLYWRDLAPKQKIDVPLDLICRIPGEYSGPASRAYLYYNSDLKHWIEPLKIHITAKAE